MICRRCWIRVRVTIERYCNFDPVSIDVYVTAVNVDRVVKVNSVKVGVDVYSAVWAYRSVNGNIRCCRWCWGLRESTTFFEVDIDIIFYDLDWTTL